MQWRTLLTVDVAAPVLDPPHHPAPRNDLRTLLVKYRGSRWWASTYQLAVTLSLFVVAWVVMWWSLGIGYWLTLLLAVPTAGFAVRLFILQHDCGHGSFFASTRANQIIGNLLGVITLTPYQCWRRQHAIHHATNGQLDHRGIGDIKTLTVAEYFSASRGAKLKYRLYRNPLVLFGIGPIFHFGIMQRFASPLPANWKRERQSIYLTNVLILVTFALIAWLIGPIALIKIELPVAAMAASAGVWLFYMQHQFDDTYWEHDGNWDYLTAAVDGSSYFDLPRPLRWITANIGFHHIHHLDSRIPNYALPKCYREHAQLQTAPRLTLWSSFKCLQLKLWDEAAQQMVTFREAKKRFDAMEWLSRAAQPSG